MALNIFLRFSILLVGVFTGCTIGSDKKPKEGEESSSILSNSSEAKIESFVNKRFTYSYSEANELRQVLSIKWLSSDTLEFELVAENQLCDYNISGTAIRNPELVKIDSNGRSAVEFKVVDGQQLESLIITHPNKQQARISYKYNNDRGECDPDALIMMEKMPSYEH